MKKSHRKDVIIARIIFAVLCLLLIALIAFVIVRIHGKMSGDGKDSQLGQAVSQQPPVTENPDLPPVTENPIVYVWTNDGVNLREEPNVNCAVITVLPSGTKLELLEEVEGWVRVYYDGQEGYVSADYITDTNPFGEEEE
jgi:uncharacterized protein YgiM (DUF1202 family)